MKAKKGYIQEAANLKERIKKFNKDFSPRGYGRDIKGKTYPQFLCNKSGICIRLIRSYLSTGPMSLNSYFILKDSIGEIEQEYIELIK